MKKAFKIASAITLSLAFAAAALEWNGYRPLDREDGSNFLCEKDKTCRTLTDGEIELARSVFGDTIDYTHIKIFNRPYYMVGGSSGDTAAVTPNGNMYFPGAAYTDDFSKGSITQKSNFIHEMTHDWQYQNGMNVRLAATIQFLKNKFSYEYDKVYPYDEKIDFKDMNLEQQAKLVEDYFRTKMISKSCYWSCDEVKGDIDKLEKRLPLALKPAPEPAP